MVRQGSVRAVAAMALFSVACGSANHASVLPATPPAVSTTSTPSSHPSPSSYPSPIADPTSSYPSPTTATSARTQCPAVQPAPQFPASTPSNRNLALVWLQGSSAFVVRDITDINHPFAVSTLNSIGVPRFASPSDLSFVTDTELVRMPFSAYPRTTVASLCLGSIGFAWSPEGTTAAYVTDDQSQTGSTLHLVSGGQNRVVSSMPAFAWGTGCEGPPCADSFDQQLLYSPDGAYISLVQTWGGPALRVWTSGGNVLKTVDSNTRDASVTMSVWSGDTLYFRDNVGVERWRNGTQSLWLPGVAWIRPKASPAGGQIVYEARQLGESDVFILDTASGTVRLLAKLRSEPAFLTSRFIWYQGERPCASGDAYPCSSGGLTVPSGKTYIYDLQTGTEAESVITKVWDVWPHPA
jgi:hypothetical protein